MDVRSLGVLVVTLSMSGCGAVRMADPLPGSQGFIEIVVDNRYINDIRIWAVSRAGDEYLGVVTAKSRDTFTHRWSRPDDLSLLVRTLGGRSFTTRLIDTAPGESVELLVPASFTPDTLLMQAMSLEL